MTSTPLRPASRTGTWSRSTPYLVAAERAWELRQNLTAYDASYVALAELLAVPLVTLDARVARATGPQCAVLAPPAAPAA